ncbi:MAG TPA: hypothetical protein DHV28_18075 [Ignavibacteriales bacterium]|nr:hypothetical protein [Ignavibacteriales bacterium]
MLRFNAKKIFAKFNLIFESGNGMEGFIFNRIKIPILHYSTIPFYSYLKASIGSRLAALYAG